MKMERKIHHLHCSQVGLRTMTFFTNGNGRLGSLMCCFTATVDLNIMEYYCTVLPITFQGGSLLPVFGVRVSVTFHLMSVHIIFEFSLGCSLCSFNYL